MCLQNIIVIPLIQTRLVPGDSDRARDTTWCGVVWRGVGIIRFKRWYSSIRYTAYSSSLFIIIIIIIIIVFVIVVFNIIIIDVVIIVIIIVVIIIIEIIITIIIVAIIIIVSLLL